MTEETTEVTAPVTVEDLQTEIQELRRKMRDQRLSTVTVARRYAKAHNLCGVVDNALQEAGLLGRTTRKDIHIKLDAIVTIEVDEEAYADIDQEALIEELQTKVKPTNLTWDLGNLTAASSVAYGSTASVPPRTRFGDVEVLSIESAQTNQGTWNFAPLGGTRFLYTSEEGRRAHMVPERGRSYSAAICGAYPKVQWDVTSSRAQYVGTINGVCAACADRASTRGWVYQASTRGWVYQG